MVANGIARAASEDIDDALTWRGGLTVLLCRNIAIGENVAEEADQVAEEAALVH